MCLLFAASSYTMLCYQNTVVKHFRKHLVIFLESICNRHFGKFVICTHVRGLHTYFTYLYNLKCVYIDTFVVGGIILHLLGQPEISPILNILIYFLSFLTSQGRIGLSVQILIATALEKWLSALGKGNFSKVMLINNAPSL